MNDFQICVLEKILCSSENTDDEKYISCVCHANMCCVDNNVYVTDMQNYCSYKSACVAYG